MAMGLPVIINKGIIEQEYVSQSSGGCLVADYDQASIADAMVKLVQNYSGRTEMGKRGREWALSHRTYESISRELKNRIDDSLKAR